MENALKFGQRAWGKPDGTSAGGWHSYLCGHCGTEVSGAVIASVDDEQNRGLSGKFIQCPKCKEGTFLNISNVAFPGAAFGPTIQGLPVDVQQAYSEARDCLSVNATTASELICRKILMHVAVDKGAKEGETFKFYIEYLETKGYVTPPMGEWVKLIKNHGNESTHQLAKPERSRAEGTILFTAQLLRSIYEMGYLANQFAPSPRLQHSCPD